MFWFFQILVDVVFAVGILILAAAHLAGRTTGAEIDVLRETVDHELTKIWSKVDGGTIPK